MGTDKKVKALGKLISVAGCLFLLFQVPSAWANACYSVSWAGHQSWGDSSNWANCRGRVPGTGDTVEITNGSPITLDQNAVVRSIAIDGGAAFDTDNNSRVLTLTTSGPLFSVASGGSFSSGNSTVVMNQNGNATLTAGAITFNNLQLTPALNGNRTYTFGAGAITINGDFIIAPTRASGTRTLTVNMGAAITVLGTTTIQSNDSRIKALLNTASNPLTSGQLNVGANGTLTANASAITLNGATGPLFTLTGTFNQGSSSVTMSSPNSVQLTAGNSITFDSLSIDMAGQTGTLGTDVVVNNRLLLVNGSFAVGANTLSLNGNPIAGTPNNLATTTSSNLSFGGSATGVILPASAAQLNNLTVNNANGLTLNGSPAINGTLTLANGAVTTGSNTLFASVSNCTAGKVQRTNGFVNGNLQLKFPSGSATCTFPVGTGTAYAPVDVTTPTLSTGGTLTASTTGSEHPDITNSPIDPTKDANRYWTLSGDTINASTYDITFNFVAGDADAAATATNFIIGEKSSGSWTQPGSVTASTLATRSTTVPGPLTSADFSVGEMLFTCTVPAGMPSTMTCVCDNFGRTSLNPSTIYGGNWSLSSSSGSFGVPKIVNSGYLRMTDNSGNVATAATMPGTFPAAGNLITVEFKHYAYNGTGADGIALTLSDANQTPTPGAYGGSLGYAQKNDASCAAPPCNGFLGGWVGVGIDEYGNYSNPTEGRNGGTGAAPDAVAVRGSGSGLTGYPYMGGTGTLSPGVDNPGSVTPSLGYAYRVTVDARCYQRNTSSSDITCNNPSLAKKAQVTVNRDTSGTGNFSAANQLITFDAYAANASQADVPTNWKLSLTGSTGGSTNIHEIQGLKICAQTITPPAGYRIEVDNLTPSTCGTPGGNPSSPVVTITALDTNGNTVTDYNKTVNLSALLSDGGASSASWSLKSGNGTLSGSQYTFVAADQGTAQFYLTDASSQTVFLSASENGGTISSSLATGVQFSGATFSIQNIDTLAGNTAGGVVAGRAHLMQVTRTNGCSTDTTFTGLKNLDGWYSPAAEHPSGAIAPQLCATNTNDTAGICSSTSGNTLGACQTLSIAAPTVDSTSNFMPALNFSQGVARFCLASSDVGKYSVNLRDDSSTVVLGSSDVLTVRPFAVAVTDITQGATGNPASSGDASVPGSLFANAGSNFQATFGGYLWNSAGDTDNDGKPDAGSDKGKVTGGGIASHYADTISISSTTPSYPTPGTGGAVTGTLTPGTVAVSNGSTIATSLNYPEVGTFTLAAVPGANYLNSSVNLLSRMAVFSNYGSAGRSTLVGRFKPDHFVLTNPSITNRATAACSSGSSFTYMGEPVNVGFQLEAHNAADVLTQNYTLGWAALDTTDWLSSGAAGVNNSIGLWMNATAYPYPVGAPTGTCTAVFKNDSASQNPTTFACTAGTSPLPTSVTRAAGPRVAISGTPATPSWSAGIGTFSANAVLERADTPDGPYDTVNIGVAPQDREGVKLASFGFDADNDGNPERVSLGSTKLRFGRLRLFNALGPAVLNLPIPMHTEYWNGAAFITNTDDNCTTLPNPSNNVLLDNYIGGITSGNMPAGNYIVGGSFSAGIGSLILKKPTSPPGSKGSVDVCVDLSADPATPASAACALTSANMPWLQGRWSSSPDYNYDPKSRATFGVYRGAPVIYLREVY